MVFHTSGMCNLSFFENQLMDPSSFFFPFKTFVFFACHIDPSVLPQYCNDTYFSGPALDTDLFAHSLILLLRIFHQYLINASIQAEQMALPVFWNIKDLTWRIEDRRSPSSFVHVLRPSTNSIARRCTDLVHIASNTAYTAVTDSYPQSRPSRISLNTYLLIISASSFEFPGTLPQSPILSLDAHLLPSLSPSKLKHLHSMRSLGHLQTR